MARSAVELRRCCARVSRAAALLRQHIDGVARASSAGTKSGSSAHSLVLHTMLAPVVENRTVQGSAKARRRSELDNVIADGGATGSRLPAFRVAPPSAICLDLPTSSATARSSSADPSISVFCANAPYFTRTPYLFSFFFEDS